MKPEINIIVAVGQFVDILNGYPIGKNGQMPWKCKEDLKWFKETTMGYPVIMGRKTFESIGRPLLGRKNIVITSRAEEYQSDDNLSFVKNLDSAVLMVNDMKCEKAFIIGGGTIYKEALDKDIVDAVYMDKIMVEADDADTFFPPFNFMNNKWEKEGHDIVIKEHEATASVFIRVRGRENKVDKSYLDLCRKILEKGVKKNTRAGVTYSLFGEQLRFDLQKGLPMLTTKKMFSKGVIHELLWFLKGNTNIKYLVENGVHIWDDDAYRHFLDVVNGKDEKLKNATFPNGLPSKERFLKSVLDNDCLVDYQDNIYYIFGDLGPVYGAQWTNWDYNVNQIQDVIHKLKTNPDDRRIMISAWNPGDIPQMALPPCHYACQFYTKEMTFDERKTWFIKNIKNIELDKVDENCLDEYNVPKRKLSCLWNQRSVDTLLGLPFNILSYAILTHMIAQCVNMEADELIFNGGDCHIYENQISAFQEQVNRKPYKYALPCLKLNPEIKNIEDFKYEDIKIIGYESYPAIKFPLSVGL